MEAKLLVSVGFSFVYLWICDFQQEMFEYLIKIQKDADWCVVVRVGSIFTGLWNVMAFNGN
jgi:hypothetical protein